MPDSPGASPTDPSLRQLHRQIQQVLQGGAGRVQCRGTQAVIEPDSAIKPADANPAQAPCNEAARLIFPGAFNPLHAGHLAMAELAQQRFGRPVDFEISVANVDKATLTVDDALGRLRQFTPDRTVWLTRAASFAAKAELFPGSTFLVGADTVQRLFAAKYYADAADMRRAWQRIEQLECRFLACGRLVQGRFEDGSSLSDMVPFPHLFEWVPASDFRRDISSTQLRQRSVGGHELSSNDTRPILTGRQSPSQRAPQMNDVTEVIPRSQARGPFFLGIDVGGTGIKFGLVDDDGRTLGRTSIPTKQERGAEDACRRMQEVSQLLLNDCDVTADELVYIGLATPGTMDIEAGKLLHPHNLSAWWDFPIRDHLAGVMGKPVAFQNDANAAAYGEYWVGSAADYRSMVLFTLGTGVGGGIIVDGMLINGQHSHGSECGHTYIDAGPDARLCGCGRRGHLEAYTSATAVVQRTQELLDAGRTSSLRTRIDNGEALTALMVAEEAERDDTLSLEVIMKTAEYLSYGAVNLIHIIDPDAIIFGGAMNFGGHKTPLGRQFLQHIRSEVTKRAFPSLEGITQVDFATLGGHAGYIGAAGVARAEYQAKQTAT